MAVYELQERDPEQDNREAVNRTETGTNKGSRDPFVSIVPGIA